MDFVPTPPKGNNEKEWKVHAAACAALQRARWSRVAHSVCRLLTKIGEKNLPPFPEGLALYADHWKLEFEDGKCVIKERKLPHDDGDDDAFKLNEDDGKHCKLWWDQEELEDPRDFSRDETDRLFFEAVEFRTDGAKHEDDESNPFLRVAGFDEDGESFDEKDSVLYVVSWLLSSNLEPDQAAKVFMWVGECVTATSIFERNVFFFMLPLYAKYYFKSVSRHVEALCGLEKFKLAFSYCGDWMPLDLTTFFGPVSASASASASGEPSLKRPRTEEPIVLSSEEDEESNYGYE
jgi:hypothetical protein